MVKPGNAIRASVDYADLPRAHDGHGGKLSQQRLEPMARKSGSVGHARKLDDCPLIFRPR